ncbi:hypothetical protein [Gracilimonas sp.]|uniref:hypothetical protein n=1 Tax=Gracilimonas sp. TaxID=1974203 RepID=UPI002871B6F3|nr:hypothetical protein [Gracilimonas sp.]
MALEFALQTNEISNEYDGLPEKNESSETLYKVYKERDNTDEALKYLEIHESYADSLHNAEISREVGRLEAEYEYRERESELREIQQQQDLENANKVANRNIFILIALSLFMIAAVFAYNQYRNSKIREKANNLLREKNKQIKEQAERLEEMNDIKTHFFLLSLTTSEVR